MKQRPILYSPDMARAKIALMKTQTRRMSGLGEINEAPDDWMYIGLSWAIDGSGTHYACFVHKKENRTVKVPSRYGKTGDILWGRETWFPAAINGNKVLIGYPATYDDSMEIIPGRTSFYWKQMDKERHIPSLHMPKEAARIWDKVVSVRTERIADISSSDCVAEGIESKVVTFKCLNEKGEYDTAVFYKNYLTGKFEEPNPRESFRSLWQLIHGTPSPITTKVDGKTRVTAYQVFPFDEESAKEWAGVTTYRGKPLTVITNPWVWRIETKQLSVTGKPVGI